MQKRILILYVLCIVLSIYGFLLYCNPYLWAQDEKTSSVDIWQIEGIHQAYFYFNFSSKAIITTNYPVTVEAKVEIKNLQLLQTINSKAYPRIAIVGTQKYPLSYEADTGLPSTGAILLTFDGNRTYTGSGQVIFPNLGKKYQYVFFATTPPSDSIFIYEMNATSEAIENRIPPVFSIEEGYSARASYEQVNQSTGTSFIAIGIAGIAIVIYLHLELGKKDDNELKVLITEIKKLRESIEKSHSSTKANKQRL